MGRRFTTRTRVAVTGAGVVGLAAALVVGAVPDDVPVPGGLGQRVPASAAPGLVAFDSCEELRRWYVAQALPEVTAYGLGGSGSYPMRTFADGGAVAEGAAGPGDAVGSSETGTTVQEDGVDEPDVAKTDGSHVFAVSGTALVVTDVRGQVPVEVSRTALPRGVDGGELLLVGDTVQVVSQGGYDAPVASDDGRFAGSMILPGPGSYGGARTRVVTLDVATPTTPRVTADTSYDGSLVSARAHGEVVRLVVADASPAIDFVSPRQPLVGRKGRVLVSDAQARRENRRLVREAPVEAWLPQVTVGGPDASGESPAGEPLLDCSQVSRPAEGSGFGTLSVIGLDGTAEDPAASRSVTGLVAAGDLAYSATDRLVVATSRWGWTWGAALDRDVDGPETSLHVFDLDGPEATWAATGTFAGGLKDRWSIDAHDDRVRVAAGTSFDDWRTDENAVISFAVDGEELVETGRADGLGIGEEIKSVRWFGDLAIVVTFVTTDPLYTVDVSTGQPAMLGELKIPGFSSYLHPIGGDRLLGLGTAVELVAEGDRRTARPTAAKASVFDVSDLGGPVELDATTLDRDTAFATDPRAFTWLPGQSAGYVVTDAYGSSEPTAYLTRVAVDDDGTVTLDPGPRLGPYDSWAARALPLPDGRVALSTLDGVRLLGS